MAVNASKSASYHTRHKTSRNAIVLSILTIILIAAVWVGLVLAKRLLFTCNDRFLLRKFHLRTSDAGYWSGRGRQLASALGLHVNADNVFDLRLGDIREKLLRIPTVENAEVNRILPDTISVTVTERIPRASLNNPNSRWVVDSHGIVTSRSESMKIPMRLPVIYGFSSKDVPVPGVKFTPTTSALELLMNTIHYYPEITIISIDVSSSGKLKFSFQHHNKHLYHSVIPSSKDKIRERLKVLQSTLIAAENSKSDSPRRFFDLTYDELVVLH